MFNEEEELNRLHAEGEAILEQYRPLFDEFLPARESNRRNWIGQEVSQIYETRVDDAFGSFMMRGDREAFEQELKKINNSLGLIVEHVEQQPLSENYLCYLMKHREEMEREIWGEEIIKDAVPNLQELFREEVERGKISAFQANLTLLMAAQNYPNFRFSKDELTSIEEAGKFTVEQTDRLAVQLGDFGVARFKQPFYESPYGGDNFYDVTGGFWTEEDEKHYIQRKALLGILRDIEAFHTHRQEHSVHTLYLHLQGIIERLEESFLGGQPFFTQDEHIGMESGTLCLTETHVKRLNAILHNIEAERTFVQPELSFVPEYYSEFSLYKHLMEDGSPKIHVNTEAFDAESHTRYFARPVVPPPLEVEKHMYRPSYDQMSRIADILHLPEQRHYEEQQRSVTSQDD